MTPRLRPKAGLLRVRSARWVWPATAVALALVAFGLGRWSAGGALSAAFHDPSRIRELEESLDAQRREIAALEVGRRIDREAQTEAQRMLGELQSQVARQNQDLEFYRGVLGKEYGGGAVRVQSVVIRRGARSGYVVEVRVIRPSARDRPIQGAMRLSLSGTRGLSLVDLQMRDLTPDRRRQATFSVRYFETVRIPIAVPADVRPGAVSVELLLPPSSRLADRKVVSWAVAD